MNLYYKIGVVILFLLLGELGRTQGLLPNLLDTTTLNGSIQLHGNAFEHSSSLQNNFSRKFLLGGNISDDLSETTYDRQNDHNRLGGGYGFNLQYRAKKQLFAKKPYLSWMINVSSESHFYGGYSGDAFGLVFVGNESFFGETANLSDVGGQFTQFLSIGGGIHNVKTKSFLTVNAILPQQFFQLKMNRGSLSFDESGEQINVNIEGELMSSNSYAYFKGLGAAINFDYNVPFGKPDSFNGIIQIAGRNLGAYQILNATKNKINTQESFNGFKVEDLVNSNNLSSLKDTLGVTKTTASEWKLTPGFVQIGKIVSANSKHRFQSFFGVRMYTNKTYRPLIYVGAHFQANNAFSLGLQGSFGGYGNLRLGIYLNYKKNRLNVGLGSEDLLGMLLKQQYGHSGLIQIAWEL